jgi:hypothetical protein
VQPLGDHADTSAEMAFGFYPPVDPLAPKRIGVSMLETPDRCVANYLRFGINPWESAWWSQLEDSRPATSQMWTGVTEKAGEWILSVRAACINTHAMGVMRLTGSINGELTASIGDASELPDAD